MSLNNKNCVLLCWNFVLGLHVESCAWAQPLISAGGFSELFFTWGVTALYHCTTVPLYHCTTVPRACDIFCHFIRISCCSLQLLSFFKSPRLVATSHLFKSIKAISDFQVLERWKQTTTFQSFKPFSLRRSKELYDHDQHRDLPQIRDVQLYFPNVQTLGGGSKNSSGIFPTGAARNGLSGERMRRLWVDDDDRNR